MCIYCDAKQVG